MNPPQNALIQYADVLWRWQILILVGTLVCGVVAAAVSLLQPPTYRATAIVESGTFNQDADIEAVISRLSLGVDRPPGTLGVKALFRRPNLVEISVDAGSAVSAADAAQAVVTAVLEPLAQNIHERNDGEVRSLQLKIETAQQQAGIAFAQVRAFVDERARLAREALATITQKEERLGKELNLLVLRLRAEVRGLRENTRRLAMKARADVDRLRREQAVIEHRIDQLRRDLATKAREALLTSLESRLTEVLPGIAGSEEDSKFLAGQRATLGRVAELLSDSHLGLNGRTLAELREAIYRSAASGTGQIPTGLLDDLGVRIPNELADLETRRHEAEGELRGLDRLASILRSEPKPPSAVLEKMRGTVPQVMDSNLYSTQRLMDILRVASPENLAETERLKQELAQKTVAARPPRVIGPPNIPRTPFSPRIGWNVSVALLLGFLIFVLLAFLTESIRQARISSFAPR